MPALLRHALRRLVIGLPLFLAVTAICFLLLDLAPGDAFSDRIDPGTSAADLQRLRHAAGLDRPVAVRYVDWLWGFLHADLGHSRITHESVWDMNWARLPATLELMLLSLVVAVAVGSVVGIACAVRRATWIDRGLGAISLVGLSIPVFWLATLAILVFSLQLGWFPSGGRGPVGVAVSGLDQVRYLVLPVLVLAATQVPLWSRTMRLSLLDALHDDHVRTARAKGLSESQVVLQHALRPALAPLVTLLGLSLPGLFTGAVITETVFAWPGIGRLFYDGVLSVDDTRSMGILAISTALVLLGNLAADLGQAALDPRVRLGERT